jgi:rubrerythrin
MDRAADPRRDANASRGDVIRRGVLLAAGLGAAGSLAALTRSAPANAAPPSAAQDREIFNFALLLEYLQAAFYTRAVEHGSLRGDIRDFAEVVSGHERAHVAYLRKALGDHARPRPTFDFGNATKNERAFVKAAILLENTGVAAYNGQAANLTKPALAAAAEIVSVEGRHAAWISDIAGEPPAPRAADPGEPSADVVRKLESLGFLKAS